MDIFGRNRLRVSAPLALAAILGAGRSPAGIALADAGPTAQPAGAPGTVERVSIAPDGAEITRASWASYVNPLLSRHGRFVVFDTYAALTASDTNAQPDVYVRDRVLATTELVSVAGGSARGGSDAGISGDGRYVAFLSSSALAGDDNNGYWDVFVRDMVTGKLTLASKATDGTQRNMDVNDAVISGDGSRVAFLTSARLSAADDDTPGIESFKRQDVYVHNIVSGHTRLVSVDRDGKNFTGPVGLGGMSYDGQLVGFSWLNPGRRKLDVPAGYYVRNVAKPGSKLIWQEDLGLPEEGAPALSGNGRYAAFTSDSSRLDADTYDLRDVARYDRQTGRLSLVSVGADSTNANSDSWGALLSYSGRYVSFTSEADNLVPGDDNEARDAFRLDLAADQMTLVSAAPDGGPGNYPSAYGGAAAISGDGQHVAFQSFASDLVPGDTNEQGDVFLWTALD